MQEFFRLSDEILMTFNSLGIKTLKEVNQLRKIILSEDEMKISLQSTHSPIEFKFRIPTCYYDLDTSKLKLFNRGLPPLEKSLITICKSLPKLKDFDGKSTNEIYSIRGIGRLKMSGILQWFQGFHAGSFDDLFLTIIKNVTNLNIDRAHFSYNVSQLFKKLKINDFSMLYKLDHYESSDLSPKEIISLLEIRTMYYDHDYNRISTRTNHPTKSFNLVADLDTYIEKYTKAKTKNIAMQRWNRKVIRSLNDVGLINNITRERTRQILNTILNQFNELFIFDIDEAMDRIFNIYYKKIDVLTFFDLSPNNNYKIEYKKSFYENFFNEIFKPIPIGYFKNKGISQGYEKKIYKELYSLTQTPYALKLEDLERKYDKNNLIIAMVIINKPDIIFKYSKKDGIIYINRTNYGAVTLAEYVIKNSNSVLNIDDINNNVVKLGGKKTTPLGLTRGLNSIKGIYELDYHVFGTKLHFGYPKSIWNDIINDCINIINDFAIQMSASAIFKEITNKYPKVRSKYELVYILRSSKKIIDLGFHTFNLRKFGQTHRLHIKKIVLGILNNFKVPISRDELYVEIIKQRSFRREGISVFHRWDEVNLYSPGYLGLKLNHKNNIKHLSSHLPYIKGLIHYKISYSLDTKVETIIKEVQFREDKKTFISLIKNDKDLEVLSTNEDSHVDYIISRYFSTKRCAMIMLYSYKRKMLINEIKILIKSELSHLSQVKYRNLNSLERKLKNDKRILNDGNYYYYNDNIDKLSNMGNFLEEVIIVLNEWGELIHKDDLFQLLKGIDDLPKNSLMLIGLLKLDDRFNIFNGDLITTSHNYESS